MKRLTRLSLTVFSALFLTLAQAQPPVEYLLIEDIEFQPGVTVDINLNVYYNESAVNWEDKGKIFAIEGMAHTANCWGNLAGELFTNPPPGVSINEFYAIDLPGKGLSGLPEGYKPGTEDPFMFEDLYLEDYIAIIRGVLAHLNDDGIHPYTIMGHSLAGMEVMLLQQQLLDEGTNLRKAYGIKNVILLAPAVPASSDGNTCPWNYLDSGAAEAGLGAYAFYNDELGLHLNLFDLAATPPIPVWPYLFYTNPFYPKPPAGFTLVPGGPSPLEVLLRGYAGKEPAPLIYQSGGAELEGYDIPPRPEIDPGIFKPKNGAQLTLVCDEWDMLMTPEEMECVYQFLTGDYDNKGFHVVYGEGTCHDTHVADPAALVEVLETPMFKDAAAVDDHAGIQGFCIFPNPATTHLRIDYELIQDQTVRISLLNVLGATMKILDRIDGSEGIHSLEMDIRDLEPGIYFVNFKCGKEVQTKKITKIN